MGNFFLKKKAFLQRAGLCRVTAISSAATSTICDRKVKIIDTPGFFDAFTPTEEILKELCHTLILAKDGIHAVAFVMSYTRFNELWEKGIDQLLRFKDLKSYLFLLLTHAGDEGQTKRATNECIQQQLVNPQCAKSLKKLLEVIDNRVIMVESLNASEDYHMKKCEELIMMIECIQRANEYNKYTNPILQDVSEMEADIHIDDLELIIQGSDCPTMPPPTNDADDISGNYIDRLTHKSWKN